MDTPLDDERFERLTIALSGVLVVVVAALCAKGVWDVWSAREVFPSWFGPAFALGVLALVVALIQGVRPAHATRERAARPQRALIFALLAASFVCSTSLHGFMPFRLEVAEMWSEYPSLRLNLLLAVLGLAVTAGAALADARGRTRTALGVLFGLTPVLLVPNDDCANPFNVWWIERIGASPLMYVPNVLAILFAAAALQGRRRRWNTALLASVCVATLMLGLGHRTRLIW
jgi:hypothetical protein